MVALCQAPFLLDDPNVGVLFPADAIARAKHYLSLTPGGLGICFPIILVALLFSHGITDIFVSKLLILVCGTLIESNFLLHIIIADLKFVFLGCHLSKVKRSINN